MTVQDIITGVDLYYTSEIVPMSEVADWLQPVARVAIRRFLEQNFGMIADENGNLTDQDFQMICEGYRQKFEQKGKLAIPIKSGSGILKKDFKVSFTTEDFEKLVKCMNVKIATK